jgi:hypothetical protein
MDYVYWIRNAECVDIKTQGYVGVSQSPGRRLREHLKNNPRIPKDVWLEIIFEGTRDECFQIEEEFRPKKNTGWNRAVGGAQGFKKGFIHSDETRKRLKVAWTEERKQIASEFRKQQNKTLIGQKRPRQSAAMLGEKNPMFGKTRTNETKKKLRVANLGKIPPNKQELYCVGCRERVSNHVLKRHTKCWKAFKEYER